MIAERLRCVLLDYLFGVLYGLGVGLIFTGEYPFMRKTMLVYKDEGSLYIDSSTPMVSGNLLLLVGQALALENKLRMICET